MCQNINGRLTSSINTTIYGNVFRTSCFDLSDAINNVIDVPAPMPSLRQLYSKNLKNAL